MEQRVHMFCFKMYVILHERHISHVNHNGEEKAWKRGRGSKSRRELMSPLSAGPKSRRRWAGYTQRQDVPIHPLMMLNASPPSLGSGQTAVRRERTSALHPYRWKGRGPCSRSITTSASRCEPPPHLDSGLCSFPECACSHDCSSRGTGRNPKAGSASGSWRVSVSPA